MQCLQDCSRTAGRTVVKGSATLALPGLFPFDREALQVFTPACLASEKSKPSSKTRISFIVSDQDDRNMITHLWKAFKTLMITSNFCSATWYFLSEGNILLDQKAIGRPSWMKTAPSPKPDTANQPQRTWHSWQCAAEPGMAQSSMLSVLCLSF